jgi:hypothetical protein
MRHLPCLSVRLFENRSTGFHMFLILYCINLCPHIPILADIGQQ